MELSQKLSKIYNFILPIEDFLYLLQLEDYYNEFYFKRFWRFFFHRNIAKRGKLENTFRIKFLRNLYFLLLLFFVLMSLYLSLRIVGNASIILILFVNIIVFSILTPFTVGNINLVTTPLNVLAKMILEKKIQEIYAKKENVKSVCIVGSYGKTTIRNYLNELLKYNFRVLNPSGNINTGAGLALWFKENLYANFDILLFETDGYKSGEIGEAAKLFQPDFVVVTAIGDQHMMRLKTPENLAKTLLEAVKYSKHNSQVIMDKKTHMEFEKLLGKDFLREIIVNRKLTILDNSEEIGKDISKVIALDLGADKLIVEDSIKNLQAPDRRGNLIKMHGFEVIDQSYNISYLTAEKAIADARKLADYKKRKLAVIVAGIPELGKTNDQGNIMLGEDMDVNCDRIYLLKSILYKDIYNKGIILKNKVNLVNDLSEAWSRICIDLNSEEYIIFFSRIK